MINKVKFSLFYSLLMSMAIGTTLVGILIAIYDLSIQHIFLFYLGTFASFFVMFLLIDYDN